jgi:hypothetical protein
MDETERSIGVAFIKRTAHKDVRVKQGEGTGIEEIMGGLSWLT